MSTVTKPIVLDETFAGKLDALNHLISHQNAAIDLLASDKRAALVTDVAAIAELAKNEELLEVMDYGDQIAPAWADGDSHYSPAMNLCHTGSAELEDGEAIPGAYFEWDKTIPFGAQFSHQRAFTAVMHKLEGALSSGGKYYWHHVKNGNYIQFTAPKALAAGQWLNYQNKKVEIYDENGQLDTIVNGSESAGIPAGTSLGDTPVMPAGNYYFTFDSAWGSNVKAGDVVSFTIPEDLQFGEKLCGCYGAPDQAKSKWKVYVVTENGLTIGSAIDTGGSATGTNLGSLAATARKTTGDYFINGYQEMAYGCNRWKFSALRQWLNSDEAVNTWWTAQDAFDVRPDYLATKEGFLAGYEEEVKKYFKPIKVVTVSNNASGNVEDVTYDRVFLSSLEQMYCVPQHAGKEGEYWEYYKRLLGRTTPAPTGNTYARLIKYALNAPTSAQHVFRRSAYRTNAYHVWYSTSIGNVSTASTSNAYRCAPGVFISD